MTVMGRGAQTEEEISYARYETTAARPPVRWRVGENGAPVPMREDRLLLGDVEEAGAWFAEQHHFTWERLDPPGRAEFVAYAEAALGQIIGVDAGASAKPVRWPLGMYGTNVPMREDRATPEDIDTLARWLADHHRYDWQTIDEDGRAEFRELAGQLAAAVFG